jgi:hypothetical protein
VNICCFSPPLFHLLVILGFICLKMPAFWSITLDGFQRTSITVRPWREAACDGWSIFGPHAMPLAPIEITPFAGDITALRLVLG